MPDIFIAGHKNKKSDTNISGLHSVKNSPHKESVEKNKQPDKHLFSPQGEKVHIFSSFCKNPSDIFFKNQEPNEKVLLFLRKHMITNIKWIVLSIFLLILPLFALPAAAIFNIPLFFFPLTYLTFFLFFYYLMVASYIYVNFITWYFNISFVTDIRVVDIDFSNLIYKNIAATKLSLVQDVSFSQIGVIPTFFDYGHVFVQTAGNMENFEFESSPQPENVVHIIHDLIGKHGTV